MRQNAATTSKTRKSLPGRIARVLGIVVGGGLLLVATVLVLAVLFLNSAPGTRFVVKQANSALAGTFAGRIEIVDVDWIDLGGARDVDARVFDPSGARVIDAHGLSARLNVPKLVWSLLLEKPDPLVVRIGRIDLRHAEVALRDDGTGSPTLARTFAPKQPTPAGAPPGRATVVVIERIEIGHAWAHGTLGDLPALDVELRKVGGRFQDDAQDTQIHVTDAELAARGLPLSLDPEGILSGSLRIPKSTAPFETRAAFRGDLAAIPARAEFKLTGTSVYASLRAERVDPAPLSALVPGLSPRDPLALWAEARGELEQLAFDVRVEGTPGDIRASGIASLAARTAVRARIVADRLNLARLVTGAPETDLAFVAETSMTAPQGADLGGTYRLDIAQSRVSGTPTPPIDVSGSFDAAEDGALRISGQTVIDEAGALARLDFSVLASQETTIEVKGHVVMQSPPRLQRLFDITVDGRLDTDLRWNSDAAALTAHVRANVAAIEVGPVVASKLFVDARATGSLSDPLLTIQTQSGPLVVPGRRFDSTKVSARGRLTRFGVQAELTGTRPERMQLTSTVAVHGPDLSFENSKLRLTDAKNSVCVEAAAVQLRSGRLEARQIVLSGAGRAQASLVYANDLERLEVTTEKLELATLARLLDPESPLKRARATISAGYDRKGGESAFVRGRIEDVWVGTVSGATVTTDMSLNGQHASGTLLAEIPEGGELALSLRGVGPIRPPFGSALLARLNGQVSVKGAGDLRQLSALVPQSILPTDRAFGKISLDLDLQRSANRSLPNLTMRLETRGLELTGKRESKGPITTREQALGAQPWSVRGFDLDAEVVLRGDSGTTQVDARLLDKHGELLTISFSTRLPSQPARAPGAWVRALWTAEVEAQARLPRRRVDQLPPLIRPADSAGVISLTLDASGSLRDPQLSAWGRLESYRSLDVATVPIHVDVRLEHAHGKGALGVSATAEGKRVASLQSEWRGQFQSMLRGQDLQGGAHLLLEQFPLDAIPALRTRTIGGRASGEIRVTGLGEDAALGAELRLAPLSVGNATIQCVTASVSARDDVFRARAKLLQTKGSADVSVNAALRWGARLAPDVSVPARARLVAKDFRLAALSPFVDDFATELDGRVDANLTADFGAEEPHLQGNLQLRDGVINVSAIGQRFHEITARVLLRPGEIRLERLRARGVSGRVQASAVAHFRGLALRDAQAQLRIPKDNKLPLTMEGVAFGDAWGRMDVAIRNPEKGPLRATVNVPELGLELPRSVGGNVQSLEPAEHIKIGMQKRNGEFVPLPLQPLEEEEDPGDGREMLVEVNLGKNVWVEKGTQAAVQLTGSISVLLGATTHVTGQIRLTGGTLDVSGKRFDIERGTITFDGEDPGNPTIFATARWDAPDGEYRVYAEYVGRVSTGKLILRSEPSLSQDEILSLVLFGSPEGHFGASRGPDDSSTGAAAAIGVAGGVATQGLTRALSDITNLDVSARVDTSSGSSRPEIVVQLSPRLSAKLSYAVGEPSPGQSPDRTFVTVELRMRGNWGISTTVGDRGASALDLVWRRRY